ncbi:MAG TPA: hypothetical protein PK280_02245 [Planctomycetota bacterium]|nr:hypothetical protein [Planctomycetota bacterium]
MRLSKAVILSVLLAAGMGCRSEEAGPSSPGDRINPPDTTWLVPWGGEAIFDCWKFMGVPKQFYFRRVGKQELFCTDRDGKVIWKKAVSGEPLWDFECNVRALIVNGEASATITWISPDTGAEGQRVEVKMSPPYHSVEFLLGSAEGDLLCRWDEGVHPPGELSERTGALLRFYADGKPVSTWDPRKNGYSLRRQRGLGRAAGGVYTAIGEKDEREARLTFSRQGELLKTEAVDYWEELPAYAGQRRSGPAHFGYQIKKKTLEVTREKVIPNMSNGATFDRKGQPVPATVLWSVEAEREIWGVSAESNGALFLLTAIPTVTGGDWDVVQVDMEKRKVVATTRLGPAGHFLMGPEDDCIYGAHGIKPDKPGGSPQRVLRSHKLAATAVETK